MNIAAYMAALDIDDLDHMAKHAVQVIAGRANQRTGTAWLSIGRVADDMGVNYATARRALNRAVKTGYLTVDKTPGFRPQWTLTSRVAREVGSRADVPPAREGVARSSRGGRALRATKEIRRISKGESDAALLARRAASLHKKKNPDPSPGSARPPSHLSGSGFLEDWTHPNGDRP